MARKQRLATKYHDRLVKVLSALVGVVTGIEGQEAGACEDALRCLADIARETP